MPTYQYSCSDCNEFLEIIQSFADEPISICPACNQATLRKVYGSVGVVFKGSGFYKTDSRAQTSSATSSSSESSTSSSATQ